MGEITPGGGYIPPRAAVTANGVSAATSAAVLGVPIVAMVALSWVAAPGSYAGAASAPVQNVGLAATLLLVAAAFGGLALLLTAQSGRAKGYVLETPLTRLRLYGALTFLGLVADVLALALLAGGDVAAFRCAAMVGTALQILALAAGIWCRTPTAGSPTHKPQR